MTFRRHLVPVLVLVPLALFGCSSVAVPPLPQPVAVSSLPPLPQPVAVSSLPPCPGVYNKNTWTDCVGETILSEGTTPVNTGDHYDGEWKNGKPDGQGVLTGKGEDRNFKYVGEFKNGGGHGQGTFTSSSGSKYVGEWKDDKENGHGTFTDANGNKYVGGWKDGKPHGQGTHTSTGGRNYVGEWRGWSQHGQGTLTFADGAKYVGEWKDNEKNGHGTYTYAAGDKYVGEWKDNEKNGHGTYTYSNGQTKVGVWNAGEFYASAEDAEFAADPFGAYEKKKKTRVEMRISMHCLDTAAGLSNRYQTDGEKLYMDGSVMENSPPMFIVQRKPEAQIYYSKVALPALTVEKFIDFEKKEVFIKVGGESATERTIECL